MSPSKSLFSFNIEILMENLLGNYIDNNLSDNFAKIFLLCLVRRQSPATKRRIHIQLCLLQIFIFQARALCIIPVHLDIYDKCWSRYLM